MGKDGQNSLVQCTIRCVLPSFLLPVIPRVVLLGFTLAQPLFIRTAIEYIDTPSAERDTNHGYGLIAAAGLVFGGMAVSADSPLLAACGGV